MLSLWGHSRSKNKENVNGRVGQKGTIEKYLGDEKGRFVLLRACCGLFSFLATGSRANNVLSNVVMHYKYSTSLVLNLVWLYGFREFK